MSKIQNIVARQILDSRGNPTVEAEVWTEGDVFGRAAVPSGASTGSREALELRDGDKSFFAGKSVMKAVGHIKNDIAPKLKGLSVFDQEKIDNLMIELDGTENKSKLGANAILATSLALSRAGAIKSKKSLFKYLRQNLNCPHADEKFVLPAPMMNIINGGMHASNNLDIQEFMIVPKLPRTFAENLRAGVEVFHSLKKVLDEKGYSTNVGDEGGFAPSLKSHTEALDVIMQAIERTHYRPGEDILLSLDAAASEFYEDGKYNLEGQKISSTEMIEYYSKLVQKYPIYSIEDGLAESDHQGWQDLTQKLGKSVMLVGDDLFVTNKKIFAEGIKNGEANSILIKVNQIGTLTETFSTMELGFQKNYSSIISHRSGETGDSFIADLAVATSSGHIKTGSASRSDRMEKYNQLLRIEEELGNLSHFHQVSLWR